MVTNEKKELFETMPVPKAILTMAVPTVISQLINLVYNIVDALYIGQTGNTDMIAGVSVAFTIFFMTIAFSNLFGIGGGSLMARLSGLGKVENARRVSAYSFYGALVIAALYSLLIGVFATPVLRVLGASEHTVGYACQYVYTVVVAGGIPMVLSAVLSHLLRNAGYSKQASFGLSMGGVLNIILDPIFMFLILPSGMEVLGAALATFLSNVASFIYLLCAFLKVSKKSALSISLKLAGTIEKEEKRALYAVGVPSAILTGLFDVANMFLNGTMAQYGDEAVAALGIVMKAERFPNAVNIGLCQGMLPIVAYNFASGNRQRMKDVIRTATLWGLVISSLSVVLFELFAPGITGIFLKTGAESAEGTAEAAAAAATLTIATGFLRIRCLASPLQFLNYKNSYCLQAMGNGSGTLIHAVFRECVFYIPFMFLLNALFGMNGLVASLVAGEACGMIFVIILMQLWQRKVEKISR